MNGTILNLGATEILTILLMALLVLGPERLPALMRNIGGGIRRLRMLYVAFVTEFRNELAPIAEEVEKVTSEIQGELAAIRDAADFRNVLNPVIQDINTATDLNTPVNTLQNEIQAPAWGFPQLGESQRPASTGESVAAEPPHPNQADIDAALATNGATSADAPIADSGRVTPIDGFTPPEAAVVAEAEAVVAAADAADAAKATAQSETEQLFANYRNIGFPEDEAAYKEMLARRLADKAAEEQAAYQAQLARQAEEQLAAASEPLTIDAAPEPQSPPGALSALEAGIITSEPLRWESVIDPATTNGPPVGVFNPLAYLSIEIATDNPWGQLDSAPRADQLDSDSPWRR
jgi:sec-independent protein translocase protein TatB